MPAPRQRPIGDPSAPTLPARLERVDVPAFVLHSRWEDVELVDPDLALIEAVEPRLASVRITGGDVGDARLVHLTAEDCELSGLNGAGLRAEGAVLRRTRLTALRLTGANLSLAELYGVTLAECRADYLSLNRARLTDVHLVDCDLREADFTGARLERVRFDRCDLTGADFDGVDVRRCEMRDCTIDGAKGVASLSGIAMPFHDIVAAAGVFAGALGVSVISEEPA